VWSEATYMPVHVDVRDVALAHIHAAENPSAKVRGTSRHALIAVAALLLEFLELTPSLTAQATPGKGE